MTATTSPRRGGPGVPRLGLLLAILVLAAACGGQDAGPGPAPSPGVPPTIPTDAPTGGRPVPVAPDPLTAAPPPGATALPAGRVDAAAMPAGLPTLVWTRGERTLGVYGRGGGCTDARAEVVEQGAERVVLRVVQFTTGPGPCTRELVYPPLEVALAAELGTRTVVLTGVTA